MDQIKEDFKTNQTKHDVFPWRMSFTVTAVERFRHIPHSRVRLFHQKSTCFAPLTLGLNMVYIWSRHTLDVRGNEPHELHRVVFAEPVPQARTFVEGFCATAYEPVELVTCSLSLSVSLCLSLAGSTSNAPRRCRANLEHLKHVASSHVGVHASRTPPASVVSLFLSLSLTPPPL